MNQQRVFVNGCAVALDPAQLIQAGGEGMVFGLPDTAVKLYHQPTPQRAAKLRALCTGLARRLPPAVLAPRSLVTDPAGQVVGFAMQRLPAGAQPLRQLASAPFWHKHALQTARVVALFQSLHATLAQLHAHGVVVGDLNDQNLFLASPATAAAGLAGYWIDVDSYQFDRFPCPVAMPAFLDPALYGVADFSLRPVFTPHTDWYAYFVLLVKSLLGVHPFGGTHKQHKSLQARAQAGVTILDPAVTYPPNARPPESLSDDLLQQLHAVFSAGQRAPFPADLLHAYAADLLTCASCGLAYPRQRAGCPACRRPTPAPAPVRTGAVRILLQGHGFIELLRVLPNGRILAITRQADRYVLHALGVGGTHQTMPLFAGRPGCRFALWQPPAAGPVLAVNPPGGAQLLLLDVGGAQPQKLTMLETARFRDAAVFAATPHHLYRIAGSWIMRGTLRDGLYLEDAVATAHLQQTRFWASPHGDVLAGYHRIFAELRFWIWENGRVADVPLPPLTPGDSLQHVAIAFGPAAALFHLTITRRGHTRTAAWEVTPAGHILRHHPSPPPPHHYPITPTPPHPHTPSPHHPLTPDTHLHPHPAGLLLQDADRLTLVS